MDILRHRLSVQPAPAEPWSCEDDWPAAERWADEAMRVAAAAAAAPAAAAVYEKLTLRVSHVPSICMAYAWRAHGSVRGSVRAPLAAACCLTPDPLLQPTACFAPHRHPARRAVVSRPAADGPGCAVPDELSPAWFLRRFAWYSRHVTAAPGLRLRMLPAIRVAAAHRRRHARPWNDTDFSASAATRGRRAFNPSLLQRARRAHATSFAASSAQNRL
eukprot:scaffold60610_cov69-Phaeocystis_antarctica.AAC.1